MFTETDVGIMLENESIEDTVKKLKEEENKLMIKLFLMKGLKQ